MTYPSGGPNERRLLTLFALICILLIAIGIAVPLLTGAWTPAPPVMLGDKTEATLVEVRDDQGRVVLSGEFRTRVDRVGNTEKEAALLAPRGRSVIGEIELNIPASGREHRRPELEVDVMGLAPRQTFSVVIDDRIVGTFTTDDRGSVAMKILESGGQNPPAGN